MPQLIKKFTSIEPKPPLHWLHVKTLFISLKLIKYFRCDHMILSNRHHLIVPHPSSLLFVKLAHILQNRPLMWHHIRFNCKTCIHGILLLYPSPQNMAGDHKFYFYFYFFLVGCPNVHSGVVIWVARNFSIEWKQNPKPEQNKIQEAVNPKKARNIIGRSKNRTRVDDCVPIRLPIFWEVV